MAIEKTVIFPDSEAHITPHKTAAMLGSEVVAHLVAGVFEPFDDPQACIEGQRTSYLNGRILEGEGLHEASIVIVHPGVVSKALSRLRHKEPRAYISVAID